MAESLSKLEEGIRNSAEQQINQTLKNAKNAIMLEVYNKWYANIFGIKTDKDIEEVTSLVINALAGDVVSKDELVNKVFDTSVRNLTSRMRSM